jgi:hypothetical protein
MKSGLLLTFLLICLNATSKEEQVSCLQKYKEAHAKKEKRYQKASKRYNDNRNAAFGSQFSNDFGAQLIGSVYLHNSSPPKRSDYDMYEKGIIDAVEADLSKYQSLKPKVLGIIYDAAYEKYSDVTYQKIQDLMLKGFQEDRFCNFLGKKRVQGIKKYVLKELKKANVNSAQVREPAVINFKEDADSKDYIQNEEINNPLENKGILE